MSRSYRPVIELWNDTSSSIPQGLESSAITAIFMELAEQAGTGCLETEYGDMVSVWIEDGGMFLDYVANLATVPGNSIATGDEIAPNGSANPVDEVVNDIKANAADWRRSIDAEGGGCLRFYID